MIARSRGTGSEQTELVPVDPALVEQRLGNGLRSWLLPRPGCGSLAFGLNMAVGSLNELKHERGISHMLEHLAFSGGVRMPAGGVAELLNAHGARLGHDYNAVTSLEHTSFSFFLPAAGPEALPSALDCLSDIAHGLQLAAGAVEVERRVILEEMRHFSQASTRLHAHLLEALLPASPLTDRHPLGTADVVGTVSAQELRDYYQRHYRPERATLLLVGDFEVAAAKSLLENRFVDWHPANEPTPAINVGFRPRAERAVVVSERELKGAEIRLAGLVPSTKPVTADGFKAWLAEELTLWLVNRRFVELGRESTEVTDRLLLRVNSLVRDWDLVQAMATGSKGRWQSLLHQLARELYRMTARGFSEAELERAKLAFAARARRDLNVESTLNPGQSLHLLMAAVPAGRPPMSAEQNLEWVERQLPACGGAEIDSAFQRLKTCLELTFAATSGDFPGSPVKGEQLLAIRRQAESGQPQARKSQAQKPVFHDFMMSPPIGALCHERVAEIVAGTVHTLRFENGVVAHLMPMELGSGQIHLQLSLAGGRIRETAADLGLTAAACLAFAHPETADYKAADVADFLIERQIRFGSAALEDTVMLRLQGDVEGFENGVQLLHLLLMEAHLGEGLLERWRSYLKSGRQQSLESAASIEAVRLLTGDDVRFRQISAERAAAIDEAQAETRLRELVSAPLEVAIVGDLTASRARHLASTYFASLPARPRCDPELENLRDLHPSRGPVSSLLKVPTGEERAVVLSGWRAAPWHGENDRRLLHLGARILRQRFFREVRESRGLAYDVRCSYSPSKAYPLASLLSCAFYVDPARIEEAASASRQIVEQLVEHGPSEEETRVAQHEFMELSRRAEGSSRYWAKHLSELELRQLKPQQLSGAAERFAAAKSSDIRSALKRHLSDQGRLEVICLPSLEPAA